MIKLEAAHIEEVRGIRKLDIDFRRENFAISGPDRSSDSRLISIIKISYDSTPFHSDARP